MLRNTMLAAVMVLATLAGTQGVRAQGYTYGVFRENAPDLPDDQRNCWTQAMVSGETINGELMAERLTQQEAEVALRREAHRGLCASQRTSTGWSARERHDHHDHDD